MSHLGRPDGKEVASMSLKPLTPVLEELLNTNVTLYEN